MTRCPSCDYGYAPLVEGKNGEGRRYRECAACGNRFATEEISRAELIKLRMEVSRLSHQLWVLTETEAPIIGARVPVVGKVWQDDKDTGRVKWNR